MNTIIKILPYTLTNNQIDYLTKAGIINWIWWQNSNIEKLILDIIKWYFNFDSDKANNLLDDIRQISYCHDIDFSFKNWFYKSNLKFAYRLFKLLHWTKFNERLWIFIFVFYLLNKEWREYYYL